MKRWTNFAIDTLSDAMDNVQTTLMPTTPGRFPFVTAASGDYFTVSVESELIKVTNSAALPWTVVRHWDGSTALPHASGAPLNLEIIAEDMNLFQSGSVILSRLDQGGAANGDILTWSAVAHSYIPATPTGGGGSDVDTLSTLADVALVSVANGDQLVYNSTTGKWQNHVPVDPTDTDTIAALNDVLIAGLVGGQVLIYNPASGKWENHAPPGGSLAGDTDVSISGPTLGQVLAYDDGTNTWINEDLPPSGYVGGDLDVTGTLSIHAENFETAVLDLAPLLYWRLDETTGTVAADSSGHIRTGTYDTAHATLGVAGATSDGDLAVGGDGAGWVASGSGITGLPTGNPPFTISAFFQTVSVSSGGHNDIAGWGDVSGSIPANSIVRLRLQSNTLLRLGLYGDGFTWSVPAVDDGQWHRFTVTYDGIILTPYLDGVSLGAHRVTSAYGSIAISDGTPRVGGLLATDATAFNGKVDEFAIFDYALTPEQETTLWAAAHRTGDLIQGYDGATETLEIQTDGTMAKGKVPLARLTQSGASSGDVPIWNATDAAWEPGIPATGGSSTLASDSDVVLTGEDAGDILTYDGSDWVNTDRIPLSSIDQSSAVTGQVAVWDGTNWVPKAQPFDVPSFLGGQPGAGQLVLAVLIPSNVTAVTFPANFSGSAGYCASYPAGTAAYLIQRNGSTVGTISISTAGVFTFSSSGGASVTCAPGDLITLNAPNPQDSTLADVSLSLVGTRT